jgi:tripartite-type tricarboxylate transporter receptor subunit TctC
MSARLCILGVRVLCLIGAVVWPGLAAAQEFPARSAIKMVVPFPAGGPADIFGRVLSEKMAALLGQSVVVENRSGNSGITGIHSVAKAEPDGYTLGIAASSALAMHVNLRESMPFHPLKDLALITQVVSVPELLVVNDTVAAKTVAELIAMAKADPGKMTFASTGYGGTPHLAMELLKLAARIDVVHVPYTGAAPAVNDLIGGHVQMMFADVPVLIGNVKAGKLRALGVGSKKRVDSLPEVATMAELGLPQVEADNWYGLVAPIATPAPVLARLHAAASEALRSADVKEKLAVQGAIAVGNASAEFEAYVKGEIDRWGKVVADTGLKKIK